MDSWLKELGLGEFSAPMHRLGIRHPCHRQYAQISDLEGIGMTREQATTFLKDQLVNDYFQPIGPYGEEYFTIYWEGASISGSRLPSLV